MHYGDWEIEVVPLTSFFGDRTARIQQKTTQQQWQIVWSEDNPADLLTRSLNLIELEECAIWWNGAKFLHSTQDTLEKTGIVCTTTVRKELCKKTVRKARSDIKSWFTCLTQLRKIGGWHLKDFHHGNTFRKYLLGGTISIRITAKRKTSHLVSYQWDTCCWESNHWFNATTIFVEGSEAFQSQKPI